MDKVEINDRFIAAINSLLKDKGLSKTSIAASLGVKPSKFSEILNNRMNAGTDMIALLCELYSFSAIWILNGRGPMLVPGEIKGRSKPAIAVGLNWDFNKKNDFVHEKKIPLVKQMVAAGFGSADFAISEADVKDYYIVPMFKSCKVDFMVEISGSSMCPKYNSGDVVACTIIHESRFIQWNKCHVIATREQGLLCKRILPSENDVCIKAVSDNKNYPAFDIPKDEITGIALVIGVIRLE